MTQEQEDRLRAWLKPKSINYLVQTLMFLEVEANKSFPEYNNIVGAINQLILESMQPK